MADIKSGKGVAAAATTSDDIDSFVPNFATGGVVLSQAGGSYKAGESTDKNGAPVPLRGWAMRTDPRKSPQHGDFLAMVLRLTDKTITVGADGKKRVQGDGEVDIVMAKKLEPYQAIFEHESLVSEVEIIPTFKEKLKNGHDLWHFKFTVIQVVSRSTLASADIEALHTLLAAPDQKALPAGTAS